MRRPRTLSEYTELVEQVLIEVDEMRHVIEYEAEGASAATAFLDPLEADLRRLQEAIATDTYEFRDEDLPFLRVVSKERLESVPFKDLLEIINWTHRTGLEVRAG
jgi:uncharacterized protein YuzE